MSAYDVGRVRRALYERSYDGAQFVADFHARASDRSEASADARLRLAIEVLSVEQLFTQPVSKLFLLESYLGMKSLSAEQGKELLATIVGNYRRYDDLRFCVALCCLVAQGYDHAAAMDVFRQLAPVVSSAGRDGVAAGLKTIWDERDRTEELRGEIDAILTMVERPRLPVERPRAERLAPGAPDQLKATWDGISRPDEIDAVRQALYDASSHDEDFFYAQGQRT